MNHLNLHPEDKALQAYLAGRVPERKAEELEVHYMGCARCSDRMFLMEWFGFRVKRQPVRVVVRIRIQFPSPVKALHPAWARLRHIVDTMHSAHAIRLAAAAAMLAVTMSSSRLMAPGIGQRDRNRPIEVEADVLTTAPEMDQSADLDAEPVYESTSTARPPSIHARPSPPVVRNLIVPRPFDPPQPRIHFVSRTEPALTTASLPVLHPEISGPRIPYQAPKLEPPKPSMIRTIFHVLSWPFRPARPSRTDG